jgi:hypothetical protein
VQRHVLAGGNQRIVLVAAQLVEEVQALLVVASRVAA